jgi:hypothetical protein
MHIKEIWSLFFEPETSLRSMVDPFFNTIHIFYTLNLILTNLLQDQTNIGLQNYFIWAVLPRPGKTTYLFEMCENSKNPLSFFSCENRTKRKFWVQCWWKFSIIYIFSLVDSEFLKCYEYSRVLISGTWFVGPLIYVGINACAVQVTLTLQIQDSGKKINLARLDCNNILIPVSVSSAGKICVHLFRYMIQENGINININIIVLTTKSLQCLFPIHKLTHCDRNIYQYQ